MRSRSRFVAVVLALAVPALALVSLSGEADAQRADAPKAAAPKPGAKGAVDAGDHFDPENVTALSQAMKSALEGNEKYLAKDYAGAIDLYKKAIVLNPRLALAHYLLGEGHLATNNPKEAEAAFKAAEEVTNAKEPRVRSHVLFALADVYERQKKWEEARVAWQAYTEHAAKLGGPEGGAHPQTGAARLKAIDEWMKLDKAYEIVRQRIAAEKDGGADAGGAGGGAGAGKPPPKK